MYIDALQYIITLNVYHTSRECLLPPPPPHVHTQFPWSDDDMCFDVQCAQWGVFVLWVLPMGKLCRGWTPNIYNVVTCIAYEFRFSWIYIVHKSCPKKHVVCASFSCDPIFMRNSLWVMRSNCCHWPGPYYVLWVPGWTDNFNLSII